MQAPFSFSLSYHDAWREATGTGEKQRAVPSTSKTPGPVPPQEGDIRPPFFVYGKAVASPPHPCKVLGFHPKPHKPFEKGLSENFTFLHPTQARGRYVPVGRAQRPTEPAGETRLALPQVRVILREEDEILLGAAMRLRPPKGGMPNVHDAERLLSVGSCTYQPRRITVGCLEQKKMTAPRPKVAVIFLTQPEG